MESNKLYLNIQEQVEKNKNDIKYILEQRGVLNEFGITVVGQEASLADLPTVADYKEAHEDWKYGDAYAIGEEEPYEIYILTRANDTHPNDYWFDLGEFPLAGPQGETGEQGPAGVNATITGATVSVDNNVGTPSVEVSLGGTESARTFAFAFHNLKGNTGATGAKGDPGSFALNGQVADASLLPSASDVDADTAYAVGSSTPYDVYVIMTVSGVQSWLNLGPVLTEISDTKQITGTYSATGTLNQTQLDSIVNDTNMDFLVIGSIYFVKQSLGNYYALVNNSGTIVVYCMIIDTSTGEWSITTKNMVDEDSAQTLSGVKDLTSGLKTKKYTLENSGTQLLIKYEGNVVFSIDRTKLIPTSYYGAVDIGDTSNKVRDIYLYRNLTDGTNSMSITDINNSTFNVINASDIVSNTFTQDQYDLVKNGKLTLIKGTFLNYNNAILQYLGESSGYSRFYVMAASNIGAESHLRVFIVNQSTNVVTVSGAGVVNLNNVLTFNNKTVPTPPSSPTASQLLGYKPNNTLAYLSKLFENSSGFGLVPPNTSGYTADKTIATTDQIPTINHLYEHTIRISWSEGSLIVRYYNSYSVSYADEQNTPTQNLYEWYDYAVGDGVYIPCTGWFKDSSDKYNSVYMLYFGYTSGTVYLHVSYVKYDGSNFPTGSKAITGSGNYITSFSDVVRQIV